MAFSLIVFPTLGYVQDWQVLDGDEITAALDGRTLDYGSAQQEFFASGRTSYVAGQQSWGYWRIEGDQYCSQWPPRETWACYRVQKLDQQIRFVGQGGDVTTGQYMR